MRIHTLVSALSALVGVGMLAQPGFASGCGTNCSQSSDPTSIIPGSVSCNAGGLHADNAYYRVYSGADCGIAGDMLVTCVEFGIESATATSGSQPVHIRLSELTGPLLLANLTLKQEVILDLANGQSGTLVAVPVSVVVPAGTDLVVELFTPDGQVLGNGFFIGSNPNGQTGPSYIVAAACGITEITDLTAIGFGSMHILLNLTVEEEQAALGTNYCGPGVPNSTGSSGEILATGSDVADDEDLTLSASNLPPGNVCLFLASANQGFIQPPRSCGNLCLMGPDIARFKFDAQVIDDNGNCSMTVDPFVVLTNPPQPILAGQTWNFQAWHRDAGAGPDCNNNFTDAVEIMFQ